MRCRCDADALLSLGGASKMSPDPNAFKVLALFLFFSPFSRKKKFPLFVRKPVRAGQKGRSVASSDGSAGRAQRVRKRGRWVGRNRSRREDRLPEEVRVRGDPRTSNDDVKTSIAARLKSTFKPWYVGGKDMGLMFDMTCQSRFSVGSDVHLMCI
jgi:hypothetical protein